MCSSKKLTLADQPSLPPAVRWKLYLTEFYLISSKLATVTLFFQESVLQLHSNKCADDIRQVGCYRMLNRNLRLSIKINIGRWIKQGSLAILGSFFLPAPSAIARDFLENTSMLDIRTGSSRSAIARNLSIGGYELSDGTPVSFADWYMPHFPEMSLLFLTQINPSLGITWGISTGERGEKYRIDPGVWLGLVYRMQLSKHSGLTFFATTLIGSP